uniref:Initiator Rep protein WH1 domain-containing protein n=1 Tax=uncultured prokaryote TaxID=198431 RepID=A0A0H5Q498_9ZZZZ|nr:hypothetical protein [uncultured prokaryote]
MKQLLLPMEKVKKSNAICRARWSPENIYEPRIVAILASKIQLSDDDFKEYEIPVVDLFGKNYGGGNYKILQQTIESLISRTVTIQEDNGSFMVYPIFTKGGYLTQTNTIKIKINSDLKHHFLKLKKQYTQYNLMEFLTLSSTYSQRLFEYLKSWEDCESTQIAVDELHKILGTLETARKNFAEFKRRILEPALKEINKKTSLEYSWKPIKFKNKVDQVLFINSTPRKESQKENGNQEEQHSSARPQPVQANFDEYIKQQEKHMAEEKKRLVEESKKNKNK